MTIADLVEISYASTPVLTYTYKDGEDILATAQLYVMQGDKGDYGRIENVFVDEAFRGMGLGTALSKFVLEESKRLGHYKCTLATSKPQALHIYERLGFYRRGDELRVDFVDDVD